MLKTILAIMGINFLIDHPYIALGVVCVVAYGAYLAFNRKESTGVPVAPKNTSDAEAMEIVELLLTDGKKMSELHAWQRDKVVEFYDALNREIVFGNLTPKDMENYSVLTAKLRNKIYEFQYSVDPNIMTDKERERIFDAIDHLNEEKQTRALSEAESTRLGLLSIQKLKYLGMLQDAVDSVKRA